MPHGVSFDSELALTNGTRIPLSGAMLSAMPLTDFGTPTFVIKDGDNAYAAQFRHRSGDDHAHITFISPGLDQNPDCEDAWMILIDTMVAAAGKRGAHSLNAEIDETGDAFVMLRRCGFAIYARQDVWKREPAPAADADPNLLRAVTDADAFAINGLYSSIVPSLVLQADAPPDPTHGFVCEQAGRIVAYISVTEGKTGVYIQPFLHPELDHQAGAIHAAVLARLPRAERLPLYTCVRRYQDWLRVPLTNLGFEHWGSQAVMVKHTVARIEHPALSVASSIAGAVRLVPPIKMSQTSDSTDSATPSDSADTIYPTHLTG